MELWKNRSGLSIPEVAVVAVIMGIVLLALTKFGNILSKQQVQANTTMSILQVSRNFQTYLNNTQAWQKTTTNAANSTTFNCLLTSSDCTGSSGGFKLFDSQNNLVYDGSAGTTTTNGFTLNGLPCSTFSSGGNDACPFQLQLTWKPGCPSVGACIAPPVIIVGHFEFKPSTTARTLAFNSQNYDFTVIEGFGTNSVTLKYHAGVATSVPDSTFTPVTYDTREWDSHNAFTGTTFTAPVSGIYLVAAGMQMTGTGPFELDIFINGLRSFALFYGSTSWGTGSGTVKLTSGDTVDIRMMQYTGATVNTSPVSSWTWLTINKLL